jgi:uncharacterized membrane protein
VFIAFAVSLVLLVIADMVLTYKCIKSGKGKEAAFAKCYIKNKWLTILITTIGVLLILLLTSGMPIILLIPIAAFSYACWNNWRALNG